MDSYYDKNGKCYTACHECEFGGNGSLRNCNVGKNITKNHLNRGCWGGVIMDPVLRRDEEKDEIREQENNC
ncbi:MAG: hypothetical protein ACI4Q5_03835 [Porcipelethomonas sp.]